jgi:AcrR family transcriptional regulator
VTDNKEVWIKAGYEFFAISGPNGLKVEPLAKRVGISKSSFYHHFADLEVFTDLLLKHHIQQSHIIAAKELKAQNISPELIEILVDHKIDLLFNRQLRINREHKLYLNTLAVSNAIVGNAFVMLWVRDLNLKLSQKQLEGIFELALENFYLQINFDNINFEWLSHYFENIKIIARSFV